MEDIEIDLRPIVRAVIRSWRLILAVAVLLALIVGGLSGWRAPTYMADAQIAIVQQDTQVDLKSNITAQPASVDPETLRSGLVVLAQNGSVAENVITTLGDKLSPPLRDPKELQSHIALDAKSNTNVMQVHVTSDNPDEAKAIATAWSTAYVKVANAALAKHPIGADLSTELEQARANYAAKQQVLSASPLAQEVTRLKRQVDELHTSLTTLRDEHLKAITETLEAQAKGQTTLLNLYGTNFWTGQSIPLAAARQAQTAQITSLYSTTNRLTQLRDDVLALRDQVQKGSTSGTGLAYSLLKAQLFAGSTDLPMNLQVQTNANDVPALSDLDALVATTEAHLKSVQDQIAALASAFRQGKAYELPPAETLTKADQSAQDVLAQRGASSMLSSVAASQTSMLLNDPKMEELETSYQKYASQLDQKEQQLYVLTQERDLAKANYTSLSTRSTELAVANATNDNVVVRVAGQGVVSGVSHGTGRSSELAFIVGLLLAVLFVIVRTVLPKILAEPVPLAPQQVMHNE